ncbi:phosphotriesterase family protein [Salinigranum sp. GCM10025319]|uniref:phosphotriesterase family protein n=1 Tax=Salinigranum sp. GCM10025319 TaxID=3252687 RepID=UPI00361800D3
MSSDSGRVVTTEGRLEPASLGATLPHEHVFIDFTEVETPVPSSGVERRIAREPVSMDNLWYVRRNPMQHDDNRRLTDPETARQELRQFAHAGGGTLVDVTPKHVGGDPRRVRGLARELGLHCVHGTAIYMRSFHPDRVARSSIDDLRAEFVSDVRSGIDATDVRAGVIGEIGLSGHIHDDEERVLRGAARAATETGAPLAVHPPGRTPHSQRDRTYPSSRWGLEILDIVEEEGLPPDRVAMCHMDRTVYEDLTYQRALADRGAYLEYDLWGHELHLSRYDDAYMPDTQRLEFTTSLIDDGYEEQLLFSQDVCNKVQYTAYGGFGYAHIPRSVWPMLRGRGVDDSTIETIRTRNPQSWLTFAAPQ